MSDAAADWNQLTGALAPRLVASLSRLHHLALQITQQPDDELRALLPRLLEHPHVADVRSLAVTAHYPSQPELDFSWALEGVQHLPHLERIFVASARVVSYRAITRRLGQPGRFGSYCRRTSYAGSFPNVQTLDLRDELLEWPANDWPDLEVLILRPRGNLEARRAWSRVVLGGAFPKLEEVRFPEHDGDELVELLMQSPLLARVRRLDCTDNLTNRGAGLLSQNADRLMHLDEIWLGSGGRREQVEPLALEIDDAWRRRLKSRFGARVRFEPRPRHPDL